MEKNFDFEKDIEVVDIECSCCNDKRPPCNGNSWLCTESCGAVA